MRAVRTIKNLRLLAGVVAAAGFSVQAFAGNVTASLSSVGGGAVLPATTNLNVRFMDTNGNWDAYNNALVGRINWINASESGFNSVSDPGYGLFSTNPTTFYTFCVEGTQNVYAPGTATFMTTALANVSSPDNVAAGIIGGIGATKAAWMSEFWNENIGSVVDNATAAGFQLGMWAIVYNATGLGYFQGNANLFSNIAANKFQITNQTLSFNGTSYSSSDAAVLDAANMLSSVDGSAYAHTWDLVGLTSPVYQDQVVAVLPPVGGAGPSPVPVPAALPGGMALLSGLMGSKAVRRMREKNNPVC